VNTVHISIPARSTCALQEADVDRCDPISTGRGQSTLHLEEIARDFNPEFPESSLSQGLVSRLSGKTLLPYGMTRHAPESMTGRFTTASNPVKRHLATDNIVQPAERIRMVTAPSRSVRHT
jgi:hypothetical protein